MGYLSLQKIGYIDRNGEYGAVILKKYRGKGYFFEVTKMFFRYIFDQLNLRKLISVVLNENELFISIKNIWGILMRGFLRNTFIKMDTIRVLL